jgi:hypothetical protein
MAMVSCRECGRGVSDSAPTCPNCGVTAPGGQAQLEIRRVKRVQGAWVPMVVQVDSDHVGNIESGKGVTLTVMPGVHRIECQFQQSPPMSRTQEFEVPPNRRLVVTVAASRWTGRPDFTTELV